MELGPDDVVRFSREEELAICLAACEEWKAAVKEENPALAALRELQTAVEVFVTILTGEEFE